MAPCMAVVTRQDSRSSSGFCLAMASFTRSQKPAPVCDMPRGDAAGPGRRGMNTDAVVDLCGTSDGHVSTSTGSSGTSTPYQGDQATVMGHQRRSRRIARTSIPEQPPAQAPPPKTRRKAQKPEKVWQAPVIIDFSSSDAEASDSSENESEDESEGEEGEFSTNGDEGEEQDDDEDTKLESEEDSTVESDNKTDMESGAREEVTQEPSQLYKAPGADGVSEAAQEPKVQMKPAPVPALPPPRIFKRNAEEDETCPIKPFVPPKRVNPVDLDNDVASFFCKANAQSVLKLVEEAVQVQAKTEDESRATMKRKFVWQRTKAVPGAEIARRIFSDSETDDEEHLEIRQEPVLVEERPSWAALLGEPAVISPRQRTEPRESLDRRVSAPKPIQASSAEPALCLDVDIDPALREAMERRSKETMDDSPAVAMPFKIHVKAILTEADIAPAAPPRQPLTFTITTKTSFGEVKRSYCTAKKLSPHCMILTYNDTVLYDAVLVAGSKLFPEHGSDTLFLVLYDRAIFQQAKEARERANADTRIILQQQPAASAPFDVSAYMVDSGTAQSDPASASADGKITIKVQIGRNNCESFRIAPVCTCYALSFF